MNKQWICCVLSFCCELVVCFLRMYILVSLAQIFVQPCLSVRPVVRDHWGLWMWSLPENCSFMNDTRAFCSSSVSCTGEREREGGREGGREREEGREGEREGGREGGGWGERERKQTDMCSTSAPATTAIYLLSFNTLPFSLGLTTCSLP